MLEELLARRNLPDPLAFADGTKVRDAEQWRRRRQEIAQTLCREVYGFLPPPPRRWRAEIVEEDTRFCAGKVTLTKVMLAAALENGEFAFPIYCAVPKAAQPCPAFVHINFRDAVPDRYMPTEEICDRGFAVFSFCYTDVTSDNGDFDDGLAGAIERDAHTGPGKITLWSWAAMRVMDYIQSLPCVDQRNVAVVGHSRLGKTALLTGALDERFAFAISNNSGCSGAALSRGKQGEDIAAICNKFGHWFCGNYQKYMNKEDEQPFDQHWLLALTAPRKVYVASAEEDLWADPVSEFLACAAAGKVYGRLGVAGLVTPDRLPLVGECLQTGGIGYHMRSGGHYFSRSDWNRYMDFMTAHRNA